MSEPRSVRRVLVLAAMPVELKAFTRGLALTGGRLGGVPVSRGPLPGTDVVGRAGSGVEVVAALTGIGPTRAAATTEALLTALDVDRVVMIGVAGALDPSLAIADLVVPESVVDAATAQTYRPEPASDVAPAGALLTSDGILSDPEVLEQYRRAGVTALDMETAAVAATASRTGRPWAAFRAISDRVQDGIVTDAILGLTRPDGSADVAAALRLLARHPASVPKLARLGRDTGRATRVAAAAGLRECHAVAAAP